MEEQAPPVQDPQPLVVQGETDDGYPVILEQFNQPEEL